MKRQTILLGICASIAAYKACDMINRLRRDNFNVSVCLSRDADRFITPLTLQALSQNPVFNGMFEPVKDWVPLHIPLADRADFILVYPASSDVISKVACGICDDLLSCVIASAKAPVLFVPAMNDVMYNNKILQSNISKLKSLSYHFIGPVKGRLCCGKDAIGHIADIDDVIKKAKSLLK